ncbi:hypothetical protein Nizo3894_2425 [Lactiplantibacillus plantarum]|nr:hypothetical protein Nizo2262_0497 [Lactiplantibacillus plantarum]KZU86443.1 hypothetical protein Nizo3894_2425 [Lactiplantibacillus plantarum]
MLNNLSKIRIKFAIYHITLNQNYSLFSVILKILKTTKFIYLFAK